jgi:hypothetical protein
LLIDCLSRKEIKRKRLLIIVGLIVFLGGNSWAEASIRGVSKLARTQQVLTIKWRGMACIVRRKDDVAAWNVGL